MVTSAARALEILELGPDADAEEIRRAFRRRARDVHPDAGGDVAVFQELQAAASLLLDGRPAIQRTSPSTGTTIRPSTANTAFGTDWGESTTRRWHDVPVDITSVAWDEPLPPPSHPWTRDLVAVAAARPLDATIIHPTDGRSRRPGAFLNRFVGSLSGDLLASFRIAPAAGRGVVGHDIEVLITTPPGRARKRLDEGNLATGWTRERRPDSTVARLLVHPSRDRRMTAARVADHLDLALSGLEWPLSEWRHTR